MSSDQKIIVVLSSSLVVLHLIDLDVEDLRTSKTNKQE